tara:strand:- start:30 stop:227 length:198 start_codon:yes stop_codon:yes gene_type:complete
MKTIKVELTIAEATLIRNALTSHAQKAAGFARKHTANTRFSMARDLIKQAGTAKLLADKVHAATK